MPDALATTFLTRLKGGGYGAANRSDALFVNGRILLQDIWDCLIADSTRTVRQLAERKPDGLFPGHGTFAINLGWYHAYSAMEEIQAGLPARQLTY